MVKTYWLTFRIADDSTYDKRYKAFEAAVAELAEDGKWWCETTSFFLFRSSHNRATVADSLKAAFNPSTDVALLGALDFKGQTVIGDWQDPDLTDLAPGISEA